MTIRKKSVLILCCIFAALLAGCHHSDSTGPGDSATPSPPRPSRKDLWKEFSGKKAFAFVKDQVEFGPRPSGSKELEKTRDYLVKNLRLTGWQVDSQEFNEDTPAGRIAFVNLIARLPATADKPASTTTQQAIVAAHYDTKHFDTIRFIGANDGGSGAGALLELARVLAMDPGLAGKVELVFLDGGEAVQQFTDADGLYGSRYYARQLRESGRNKQFKFAILWDMIGKKDEALTLPPDSPPELVKGVLAAAEALGLSRHFTSIDRDVPEDHLSLNASGIPAIDLADLDDIYWHTADDTLDKLSPESLQITGAVTLYYLQQSLAK